MSKSPTEPKKAKKQNKGGFPSWIKWVLIAVAALLLIAVVVIAIFFFSIQNPQNAFKELVTPPPTAAATPTPVPTPEDPDATPSPTPEITPEPTPSYTFEQKHINILLLGADSSVERVDAGMNFRTDTMILVSVNFTDNTVDMISIPRDSYVKINGGETCNKINAAFTLGGGAKKDGYEYAMNTVEHILGVPIDYYVGFGMNVVKDVVDAVGGVDYDVDIAFTMNGRPMEKGMQHLTGQQVLDYCRFRKGGRGDVDRVERQQKILFAMYDQMLTKNLVAAVPRIYQSVMDQIDTNLDLAQIGTLAYFGKDLSMENINRHTIPGNGQYVGDRSYYLINQESKNKLVKEIFGVDGPFDETMTAEAIIANYEATVGDLLPDEIPEEEDDWMDTSVAYTYADVTNALAYVRANATEDDPNASSVISLLQWASDSDDPALWLEAMRSARAAYPGCYTK